MSFLNDFPHVRQYDGDLGWLIRNYQDLAARLEYFVRYNAIKYADPIAWNITHQYEANTVVIDPESGTAYISTKPVPSGILVTDTDYWTPIFNYGESMNTLREQIAAADEGVRTTASAARTTDELVWINGLLYRVLYDIAAGTAYIEGTNIERVTVEDMIRTVREAVESVVASDITTLGAVGDGVTNDSAAINAAMDNDDVRAVHFPPGRYLVRNINLTKTVIMDPDAWLLYGGDEESNCVNVDSNGEQFVLNVDMDGRNPHYGITVNGDRNHFKTINIKNMHYDGSQSANSGVHIVGSNNTFDFIRAENFVRDIENPDNDSCPQVVAIVGDATENYIADVEARNCLACVVNAANAGTVNAIGVITAFDAADNGLYLVSAAFTSCGQLNYIGENEALAVINGASGNIGDIVAKGDGTIAVRLNQIGTINIGSLAVFGAFADVLFANQNTGASGRFSIGRITTSGDVKRMAFLPQSRVQYASGHIGEISGTYKTDADYYGSFAEFGGVKDLSIGSINVLVDTSAVPAGSRLNMIINTDPQEGSHIGPVTYSNGSGITHPFRVLTAFPGTIRYDTGDVEPASNQLVFGTTQALNTNAIPTAGTWKRGDLLLYDGTNSDIYGYKCVEAGTPGVWKELHTAPATYDVRYRNGQLQYFDGSNWQNIS